MLMHADKARAEADKHRNEINNIECSQCLDVVMEKILKACVSGKYELYEPFKGMRVELISMVSKRLAELGYEVKFNVGDDGPNRPGHDELRWKR